MEKPGTSIRRTGMNTKICGNQMSFQMELNALQKKSAEMMAIQNTRMLFFVLQLAAARVFYNIEAAKLLGRQQLWKRQETHRLCEKAQCRLKWPRYYVTPSGWNTPCLFLGGCFMASKFSTNFQSLVEHLPKAGCEYNYLRSRSTQGRPPYLHQGQFRH